MMRASLIFLALLSPFIFPSPLSGALSFAAALVYPPVALVVGLIADALYYPGSGYPLATLIGVAIALVAFFMRGFAKARIMAP
ncbi:MAG: hypothetical protein ABA06_02170 [Parcubacteria bacterium C7867-001]|nr:MAG: hypothetical protein ABA06_02170 [Parcubacteria bacterium C7867-001]